MAECSFSWNSFYGTASDRHCDGIWLSIWKFLGAAPCQEIYAMELLGNIFRTPGIAQCSRFVSKFSDETATVLLHFYCTHIETCMSLCCASFPFIVCFILQSLCFYICQIAWITIGTANKLRICIQQKWVKFVFHSTVFSVQTRLAKIIRNFTAAQTSYRFYSIWRH